MRKDQPLERPADSKGGRIMQQLMIIGNLTKDPELRTTATGLSVCSFTVAVNRRQTQQQRQNHQQPEADYFRVSAWRERGEVCGRQRKCCVFHFG